MPGSDGDDDLAARATFLHVPDGRGDLAERVGPDDDRRHRAGVDEPGELAQVLRVLCGDERTHDLTDERGQRSRTKLPVVAPQPPPARLGADDDERALRGERAPQPPQRTLPSDIEDDVVA